MWRKELPSTLGDICTLFSQNHRMVTEIIPGSHRYLQVFCPIPANSLNLSLTLNLPFSPLSSHLLLTHMLPLLLGFQTPRILGETVRTFCVPIFSLAPCVSLAQRKKQAKYFLVGKAEHMKETETSSMRRLVLDS